MRSAALTPLVFPPEVANPFWPRRSSIGDGHDITSIKFGTPFNYNSQYPTKYVIGDQWASTWADDGNIYTVDDDSLGFQDTGSSNFQLSRLSGYTPSMSGTNINNMTQFGYQAQLGSDGDSYKAFGLISVRGALYIATNRTNYGNNLGTGTQALEAMSNCQIIKSTNHGMSWSPLPPSTAQPYLSPMFPGTQFATCWFIQYGQDYQSQTVDRSDQFVYALSTEAYYANSNKLLLGRVSIANLPNLNAADWSFYQGGDGSLDANWGSVSTAAALINNTLKVSCNGAQYLPAFRRYIYFGWWYPSIVNNTLFDPSITVWDIYQAPHPWGPWTKFQSMTWDSGAPEPGLYNPNITPQSVAADGEITATILTSANYFLNSGPTTSKCLILLPITLHT